MTVSSGNSSQHSSVINKLHNNPVFRRRIIWVTSIAVVFLLLLVALPIVTSRIAISWLQDNGASNASIDDIDINLFTGTVVVSGLEAGDGPQQRFYVGRAELNVRWWPVLSKRAHVQEIRLSDVQGDIVSDGEGGWHIGAVHLASASDITTNEDADKDTDETLPSEAAPLNWGFGAEAIELSAISLRYQDSVFDTDLEVRQITIGHNFSWLAENTTDFSIDMDINGSPLRLSSDITPWSEQQRFSGDLQVSDLDIAVYQSALQSLAGLEDVRGSVSVDLNVKAFLEADGVLDIVVSGPLSLNGIGFTHPTLAFSNESINWQGLVQLRLPAAEGTPLLEVDGALQLSGSSTALESLGLTASLSDLEITSNVEFTPARNADSLPDLKVISDIRGQGLKLLSNRLPFALVNLNNFSISDIDLRSLEQGAFTELQLQGLQLLAGDGQNEAGADVFQLAQLTLSQLGFATSTGITVDSVLLNDPAIALVRDSDGQIERLSALLAAYSSETEASAEADNQSGSTEGPTVSTTLQPPINIKSVQVQAQNLLTFNDRSVSPAVNFPLTEFDLLLRNIDSASAEPMVVLLTTGNGNLAINLEGTINAFSETLTVDLVSSVAGLDLPVFSAYVPGYNIDTGRVRTESTLSLVGDALDLQNSLLIERLKLTGKAAEGNAILGEGMAMPLDVALDLLRDSDDHISLELPVTGSLQDPSFSSADIIRTVMQNAIQNAAMSYVKTMLQPLGTLMLIGDLASKAATPRFEPLAMVAGESGLSATDQDYLTKIAELLTERPGLHLSLCGVSTEADRQILAAVAQEELRKAAAEQAVKEQQALAETGSAQNTTEESVAVEIQAPIIEDAALLELATMRTSTTVDYLAEQGGVGRERLFSCRASIDNAQDAEPRVRISL